MIRIHGTPRPRRPAGEILAAWSRFQASRRAGAGAAVGLSVPGRAAQPPASPAGSPAPDPDTTQATTARLKRVVAQIHAERGDSQPSPNAALQRLAEARARTAPSGTPTPASADVAARLRGVVARIHAERSTAETAEAGR